VRTRVGRVRRGREREGGVTTSDLLPRTSRVRARVRLRPSASFGMRDEPLESDVDVVLFLARNGVTANLAVLDSAQVHFLDEFLFVEGARQVSFVAQDQDGNARQLRLVQQILQFVPRRFELFVVGGVHHVNDAVDPATVPLPHGPEARLTADVPQLDGHVALRDLPHVESYCGDHVFAELTRRNNVDECRFPGVLQADQRKLHLFFPEETFEPV